MDTRRATMHRHPFVRSHDESHDIQPLSTGVTNAIVLDGHCPRSAQRRISGTTKLRLKLRPHFGEPIPPLEGKESLVVRAPFQFPRPDDADPDGDVLQPHRHRRSAPRCRGHRDDPGYPIHGTFPGILASRRPPPPPLDPATARELSEERTWSSTPLKMITSRPGTFSPYSYNYL